MSFIALKDEPKTAQLLERESTKKGSSRKVHVPSMENERGKLAEFVANDVPGFFDRRINSYRIIKLFSLAAGLYYIGITWLTYDANGDGRICPLAVFCAENALQFAFMTISRSSAGLMYPTYFVIFLTKARFTISVLSRTFLSELVDFRELHELHKYFGAFMTFDATIHTIFHLARWGVRNELHWIHDHRTGWSGLYGWILTVLIAVPFWSPYLRRVIPYEVRKPIHYLFVPWAIILTVHQFPRMLISFWVILVFYCLDFFASYVFLCHRIENPEFHPVGTGTAILFDVPPSMQKYQAGQYVYVNFPWLAKSEWHPFSLIANAEGHHKASLYVLNAGDWSNKLFQKALVQRGKPIMWLHGPHPSPFDASISFNKLFLLATGVGITPAISVIEEFYSHREIVLIWSCRDAYMVEFFLKQLGRVESKVFFTGDEDKFQKLNLLNDSSSSKSSDKDAGSPAESKTDLEDGLFTEYEDGRAVAHTIRQAHQQYEVKIVAGRPDLKKEIIQNIVNGGSMKKGAEGLDRLESSHQTRLASKTFVKKHGGYGKIMESSESEISDWMVLYCGASKRVSETAEEVCKHHGITYRTEFFDSW